MIRFFRVTFTLLSHRNRELATQVTGATRFNTEENERDNKEGKVYIHLLRFINDSHSTGHIFTKL